MKRILINGFGRIGRTFLRCLLADKQAQQKIMVVAINMGPSDPQACSLLFKHDSLMRTYQGDVDYHNGMLKIDHHTIRIFTETDPERIPYKDLDIDWVVESSGHFTTHQKASLHLQAGAQKVLITAPAADADITIIPGINMHHYHPEQHTIVSLGSCTTNAFAPLIKILTEHVGIEYGLMTTTHAYTNDQVLLDVEHKDPRRARAAALNIIPTKTGADRVITSLFPKLQGRLKALAIRVPVPIVSLIDVSFIVTQSITAPELNAIIQHEASTSLKNILEYQMQPLVSSDFIGNPHSCIVDSLLTQDVGPMIKLYAWYDNEYGYSQRLKDFLCTA